MDICSNCKCDKSLTDSGNCPICGEVGLSSSNALLVASKREWLIEAQKLIDGMTADEFESFINECSTLLPRKQSYRDMGW
jgi:hypothetical protein